MHAQQWITGAATAVLLLSPAATAMAQQPMTPGSMSSAPTDSLSDADRQFVLDATRGSERDVELGELAKDKAQHIAVKELGARMVTDRGQAARELKALALTKGLRVGDTKRPEQPSYDLLTKVSSPEFDRAYLEAMAREQAQEILEYTRMSEQGQDPELKAWAARALPTLESQMQTITELRGRIQG